MKTSTAGAAILLLVCLTSWSLLRFVALPISLQQAPVGGTRFTDRHGTVLRETLLEGGRFVIAAPLDTFPPHFLAATIAAEDKRFWSHRGIDPLAVARAARNAVAQRRFVSGASTISQQLIKIAERRPRTIAAKISEAVKALRLEQGWTKNQILEAYLNRVDYGNFRIGAASAAAYYFDKPLGDLSLAESAFLAGLPQAPSRLNPRRHLDRALERQRWVLGRMRQDGLISAAELARARAEPIRLAPRLTIFDAPHFVDLVAQQRRLTAGTEAHTTLDLPLTNFSRQALRRHLTQLRDQHVQDGAVVVIENRTGNVLLLVGSTDYFSSAAGQVNGAWAARSAGSTLKPFTYLLALEHGASPASVIADVPVAFATSTGVYRPENYNHLCYGPVRLRTALANSLNIPAVKMLASVGGAEPLRSLLQHCGLSTLPQSAAHYGLGLTIGNANARLLELVNAYAALARLGQFRPYRLLQNEPLPPAQRIGDPGACYLLADILSDNSARALGFGAHSWLQFVFPVAVKTGTSTSFRDNWAIGFTPEFTAGVWVGNFDGTAMRDVSGVSGAAPVLHEVFDYLHEQFGTSWYAPPPNVTEGWVHPLTGKLAAKSRPGLLREKFISGHLPALESPYDYDAAGRVKLGPEYQAWLASVLNESCQDISPDYNEPKALHVISPLPGTTYLLDPDLPESDSLPLKSSGSGELVWESATLPCTIRRDGAFAQLKEGRHSITLRNPKTGARVETWILVKAL
jgi:penicillin-binding protein 1C